MVNALNGVPVARALVTVNAQSALCDSQGHFQFAAISGPTIFASVRKPGFSAGIDPSTGNATQRIADPDAPILLKLLPDALLTGRVTGRDGAPLSHVSVRLLRAQYEETSLNWSRAGFTLTDSRGEYRISTPAGRFRVTSDYLRRSLETGQTILPASFPQPSETNSSTLIELVPGEERRIDLRAEGGPVHPVLVHFDPAPPPTSNLNLSVLLKTGEEFHASLSADQHLELPSGTYTLQARSQNQDQFLSGSAQVTVTSTDTSMTTIHLVPDTLFTVELQPAEIPANSNSNNDSGLAQLPNLKQFNLSFQERHSAGGTSKPTIRLQQAQNNTGTLRLPPGSYRPTASGVGPWHIQSALLGSTDLRLNDLVVAPASAGGTIRLLAGNQIGTVHVRARLAQPTPVWLYLLPREPSLNPIRSLFLLADPSGAQTASASFPAGSYTAVLLDHRLEEDPRDPNFLASFASGPTDLDVQPGADTSLNLGLSLRKKTEP